MICVRSGFRSKYRVRVLFDSSVIVAAFVASHNRHQACTDWLDRAKTQRIQGILSTHSLAEIYSVVTRLPVRPRINPDLAQTLLNENLRSFEVVSLEVQDYRSAISRMVALNLPGGGIFDALIAQAAIKSSAEVLLTLNPKHFERLESTIANLVEVP
ncbi:PilT protein domain protein [Leptolyngbya sp. NIES-3755]|nr:PilT protein domain protein [Leptolyngbya sp. NIES-3755]